MNFVDLYGDGESGSLRGLGMMLEYAGSPCYECIFLGLETLGQSLDLRVTSTTALLSFLVISNLDISICHGCDAFVLA